MSTLGELNESLLAVTTAAGVLDAVETAYNELYECSDSLSTLLGHLLSQVSEWEAWADNSDSCPSVIVEEDFVNGLKDQVEEWIVDNR